MGIPLEPVDTVDGREHPTFRAEPNGLWLFLGDQVPHLPHVPGPSRVPSHEAVQAGRPTYGSSPSTHFRGDSGR
eukprot:8834377-Pyramimonas_sp.AAC.1